MKKSTSGFTIVELLIVIVIIAILAAITVTAYNGIQERSRKAYFLSDISNIKKAMEFFKTENGTYPQCPSGPECGYISAIKPQLEPKYASGLSNYNFAYVTYVTQLPGTDQERWGMRYVANADPYKVPQTCKFGVNMASTWYSSAPEC